MKLASAMRYRPLHPGMGAAVAERTYLRRLLTAEAQALCDQHIVLNPNDPDLKSWLVALNNTGGFRVRLNEKAASRGTPAPTRWESWGELAARVAEGNASLLELPGADGAPREPPSISQTSRRCPAMATRSATR